jgi:hypothetical protein
MGGRRSSASDQAQQEAAPNTRASLPRPSLAIQDAMTGSRETDGTLATADEYSDADSSVAGAATGSQAGTIGSQGSGSGSGSYSGTGSYGSGTGTGSGSEDAEMDVLDGETGLRCGDQAALLLTAETESRQHCRDRVAYQLCFVSRV